MTSGWMAFTVFLVAVVGFVVWLIAANVKSNASKQEKLKDERDAGMQAKVRLDVEERTSKLSSDELRNKLRRN